MKKLALSAPLAVSIVAALTALPAAAQFAKSEDAIEYRQGAFFVMGQHFGRIAAVAQGKAPYDAKTTAENAAIVLTLSKLPFTAFVDGTQSGHNTKAKAEVWSQRDKFDAAAKTMQDEVVKLDAAAKSGDLDQIKAAVGATGKACKACHDDYRAK